MTRADELIMEYDRAGAPSRTQRESIRGFVRWQDPGDFIEGILESKWEHNEREYINLRVSEIRATVGAKNAEGGDVEVEAGPGSLVAVSVSNAKLKDTITDDDVGRRILIVYNGEEETRAGNLMKLLDLWVFPANEDVSF